MTVPDTILIFLLFLSTLTKAQTVDEFYSNYDTGKTALDNYDSGFANVIHTYGNTFRIRGNKIGEESPMILEKWSKSSWTFVDSFEYSYCFTNSVAWKIAKGDYNLDGINDFIIAYTWNHEWDKLKLVYTYDKAKKNLFRVGYFIEKPRHIKGYSNLFYDKWYGKWSNWSYIFTIRNNERVNLGIAELKVKLSKSTDEILYPVPQYISIRKKTTSIDKEITRVPKNKVSSFDFKTFWTENAKLFLNSDSRKISSQKNEYPTYFQPDD